MDKHHKVLNLWKSVYNNVYFACGKVGIFMYSSNVNTTCMLTTEQVITTEIPNYYK